MGEIKLKIADLESDHDNPRISHAAGQQEALQKIVTDQKNEACKARSEHRGLWPQPHGPLFGSPGKQFPNPFTQGHAT